MPGPVFLGLYAIVVAVTLYLCWRAVSRRDESGTLPPLDLPTDPDPYELAYLRGGANEVLRLLVFSLIQRGYIEIHEPGGILGKKPPQIRHTPRHPDPGHLSGLERRVFDGLRAPLAPPELFKSPLSGVVDSECAYYRQRAESESLVPSARRRDAAWTVGASGAAVMLGLGAYKVLVALEKGRHNLGFLIVLQVIALVALITVCRPRRLSRRGAIYLQELQARFAPIQQRVKAGRTLVPDAALLLGVSLFGMGLLDGTPLEFMHKTFQRSASSGGCGGGGGCGGSGCSGGCGGGGCGGGCGGCGG
jgi:uncharacterized protein (TIGR04222 family)